MLLEPLAERLGATVGASERLAVDSGFCDNSFAGGPNRKDCRP